MTGNFVSLKNLLAMSRFWRSPSGKDYIIAAKDAPEAVAELCHLDPSRQKELSNCRMDSTSMSLAELPLKFCNPCLVLVLVSITVKRFFRDSLPTHLSTDRADLDGCYARGRSGPEVCHSQVQLLLIS